MPQYSTQIGPSGALLNVFVGVSAPRLAALLLAQQVPPQPVPANLQIDTGAKFTAIDAQIVAALGLQPTGAIMVTTPSSGPQGAIMPIYDVGLVMFGAGWQSYTLGIHPVLATDFSAQGISGLLGRDILSAALLTYSGPDNFCMLSL
jgi:hypothetical protein